MAKYFLFIIVFFISFTINISISRGESKKNSLSDKLDVYYKKTLVFRGWENKDSKISQIEIKLLTASREKKIEKKESPLSSGPGDKLIGNLLHGSVILAPPEEKDKTLRLPVANGILMFPFKIVKKRETAKHIVAQPQEEKSNLIFGSMSEKDCFLDKKYCGFDMNAKVKVYNSKLAPKTEKIDSSKFPIDF